jgi:UDP-glucose 4-epimerase
MKRILITGANSYIGTSFEKWLHRWEEDYLVDTIDMVGDTWKQTSFSSYDTVFHVAGIAHIRETKGNAALYYKVNRDLAYEAAQKAKDDGVKQFIFLSSMSVYGIDNGVINRFSPLNPKSNYGKSKLQAEKLIGSLEDNSYKVVIMRPPIIYGKGCKGNYMRLAKFALLTPFFPNVQNKRSMIYINNFCEFTRLVIDDRASGLFFPQNLEYVCISEMVKLIAEMHGRKMHMTKLFNPLLRLLKFSTINKVFNDLIYENTLSSYKGYKAISTKDSIKMTEL